MKEANKAGCRAVRKRQNRVEVYLNDEELKLLDELSGFCIMTAVKRYGN